MSQEFSISWGSLWKILAMLAFVAVIFVARDILIGALLAIVISSAIDPLVTWLEHRRVPRILSTLGVYIIGLFIIALIIYIVIPIFLVELNSLLNNSGTLIGSFTDSIGQSASEVFTTVRETLNTITSNLLGGKITLITIVSQFFGGILFALISFIISFYLTVDADGVEKFLVTILPYSYQEGVLNIYAIVRQKISAWFMGQLVLSVIVGTSVFFGLWLLGVKYSLLLGITAGVFEIIPYVGPIFSGSLAVIFATTTSVQLGVYAFLLFVLIQQLESHVLIPAVTKYTTNLSPVVVLISLLVGGQVLGIVGIILAVPIAMLFQVMLKRWALSHPAKPVI